MQTTTAVDGHLEVRTGVPHMPTALAMDCLWSHEVTSTTPQNSRVPPSQLVSVADKKCLPCHKV